jgi:hypothetical protein
VISLVEENETASFDEHDDGFGYATFTGIVNVTSNQLVNVVISFSASDTWSSSSVSPPSILFTESGQKTFTVQVQVPRNEKYNSEGFVTVSGIWTIYPGGKSGSCDPVTGRIIVGQFYNFSIIGGRTLIETDLDSKTEFTFDIQNSGNHVDTFYIEVLNLEELNKKGFKVTVSPSKIEISQGLIESVKIIVETPEDTDMRGQHKIKVQVTSVTNMEPNISPKELTFDLNLKMTDDTAISESYSSLLIILVIIIVILVSVWYWRRKKKRN